MPEAAAAPTNTPETIKETLISIIIAFALAFVFRGFVIEAFVIPTGSMAPTLMGAHMKFRGSESGVDWAVGPWDSEPPNSTNYINPQDGRSVSGMLPGRSRGITVYDPGNGDTISRSRVPLYAGDRILVLKYLYSLLEPRRYDVVVFKNPTDPSQNYIKRLIGLPGEELALVDGDVFSRRTGTPKGEESTPLWEQSGWTIARKPALQQRAVWQTVFDSADAPSTMGPDRTPWTPSKPGDWTLEPRMYRFSGGQGELLFNQEKARFSDRPARFQKWSIDDYYAYNETPLTDESLPARQYARFPVSDVRVRLSAEPSDPAQCVLTARLTLRGHDYELSLAQGKAEIRERPVIGAAGVKGEWRTLSSGAAEFASGHPTLVEFWHSDQSLQVWVEGSRVAYAEYDWSPGQRIAFATGKPLSEIVRTQEGSPTNLLANASLYSRPEVRIGISGPACVLRRVGLDRDLYYQPGTLRGGFPAHATSPFKPLTLGRDEFFCCGDNSPASLDGRLWDKVDDWVDYEFRPGPDNPIKAGIVPRELMLGRAFFVYWPSIRYEDKPAPMIDFGRMRFIW